MSKFKPKPIEQPPEIPRPTSAEIAATIGPLASNLIPTGPVSPALGPEAPIPTVNAPLSPAKSEPVLMMSFKASKPFARMLARAAEPEGGLRRLVARVFKEAGYDVPDADLYVSRRRRTYD